MPKAKAILINLFLLYPSHFNHLPLYLLLPSTSSFSYFFFLISFMFINIYPSTPCLILTYVSIIINVQGIGVVKGSVVESSQRQTQIQVERSRVRPHKEQALNCPRCNSTNTKFCYYNNYSLSQPRYFCKTCRRYWTEGGSLRNVPVGGGSRKNKRSSNSSSSSSSSSSNSTPTPTLITSTTTPTTALPSSSSTNLQPSEHMIQTLGNSKFYQGGVHDLNLSFPNQSLGGSMSALELLRSGISARGLGPFVPAGMPPAPGAVFGAGFGFQDLMRPASNNMKLHPLDGVGGSSGFGGSVQEEGDGRLLFPFEDLKQVNMSSGSHEGGVQGQGDPTLFWNGIMGSGGNGNNGGGGGGGGGGSW